MGGGDDRGFNEGIAREVTLMCLSGMSGIWKDWEKSFTALRGMHGTSVCSNSVYTA